MDTAPGRLQGGVRRRGGATPSAASRRAPPRFAAVMIGLYRLQFRSIARFILTQRPSYWLICIYLVFEYVRPQSLYPSIDILPWTQWSILGCAGAIVLEGRAARRIHLGDQWLGVFTAVVLASCIFAVDSRIAFSSVSVFLTWVLVYWLITVTVDTEERFLVFMGLFLLSSLKMSQHASRSWASGGFAFRDWGALGAPGWFHNSGEMAIQMTIFLPLSVYFLQALRPHLKQSAWLKQIFLALLPATAVVALLASSSRGGQLGGAAVVLWMVLKSRRRVRGLVLMGAVALGTMVLLPAEQRQRFADMGSDRTSQVRLTLWRHGVEIANEHPVLGIGYDNWMTYHAEQPQWDRTILPHNIFVQAGSELGYTGLLAFVALIITTLVMNHRTRAKARRLPDGRFVHYMAHGLDAAMIGYLVSGFFVTVLYYPYFWINFAMSAALYGIAAKRVRQVAGTVPVPSRAPTRGGPRGRGFVPAGSR